MIGPFNYQTLNCPDFGCFQHLRVWYLDPPLKKVDRVNIFFRKLVPGFADEFLLSSAQVFDADFVRLAIGSHRYHFSHTAAILRRIGQTRFTIFFKLSLSPWHFFIFFNFTLSLLFLFLFSSFFDRRWI